MLNTILHGDPTARPPLVIAHGLYGSARNWGVIARRLSDERQVIAVDHRNHGDSPWADSHTYPDMAADLAAVIETLGQPVDLVGHSMGGKAAMVLALTRPDLLRRLIVADIAPVTYPQRQSRFIDAMKSVDLTAVRARSDAVAQLEATVEDPMLRSFFTQSLDVAGQRWRLNLDVLGRDMEHIVGFPAVSGSFAEPTLFLTGADSDYVQPEARPVIRQLFPKARFAKIPGAGHWLHAEKPREFEASVRAFLNA